MGTVPRTSPRLVPVRDSKCPQGPTLSLSTDGWDAFVSRVKDAEFPAP
ncbi:DUF397 domain-containing protein [Streptomyces scopuliridis]